MCRKVVLGIIFWCWVSWGICFLCVFWGDYFCLWWRVWLGRGGVFLGCCKVLIFKCWVLWLWWCVLCIWNWWICLWCIRRFRCRCGWWIGSLWRCREWSYLGWCWVLIMFLWKVMVVWGRLFCWWLWRWVLWSGIWWMCWCWCGGGVCCWWIGLSSNRLWLGGIFIWCLRRVGYGLEFEVCWVWRCWMWLWSIE